MEAQLEEYVGYLENELYKEKLPTEYVDALQRRFYKKASNMRLMGE